MIQARVRDEPPRGVGGVGGRADAARRGDAGRDPRVRRAHHRRRLLVQGAVDDERRSARPCRATRRPRARRPRRRAGRPPRPAAARCRRRRSAVAIVLSSFPTKHARSATRSGSTRRPAPSSCSTRCATDGYAVERRLRRRRRADPRAHRRRRPRPRVPDRRAARAPPPARLPVAEYAAWFADAARRRCARRCRAALGRAAGRRATSTATTSCSPASSSATCFVAIQPPRGFGENPIGDLPRPRDAAAPPLPGLLPLAARPASAPTRSSTSASTARSSGCRARASGSRPACAPDAALGDLPLVYPFVVNDPGEGTQAKRRAHAVIVDHLVPPMTRADTYDELAAARAAARRVRAAARRSTRRSCRRWPGADLDAAASSAELHHDLDVERRAAATTTSTSSSCTSTATCARSRTSRSATACTCWARAPEGEQLRRPAGGHPAPGRARARARAAARDRRAPSGSTSRRCSRTPAPRCVDAPPALLERFPGPSTQRRRPRRPPAGRAVRAASPSFGARGCAPDDAAAACAEVLGHDGRRRRDARCASPASEVVPRLRRARPTRSTTSCAACAARYVPAGPSRRADARPRHVLPTGRNFYSVDPKALPSRPGLGRRPAARRRAGRAPPRRRPARYPETVGLVGLGHGGDAHAGRRRRRDPRAARRAPGLGRRSRAA